MRRSLLPLLVSVVLSACSNPNKEGAGSPLASSAAANAPAAAVPLPEHHDHAAMAQPHQDHGSRHGGVVTMEGDNHVEVVVGSDGMVDLYVSDAVRRPIAPKDLTGTIAIEPKAKKEKQILTLTEDPAKGSLSAKGPAPSDTDYTWDVKVGGAPMHMTLTVPAGGTAALADGPAEHHAGDHAHGSPHGGVVQSLGDGHVEVKLDKSGDVTLWMLDASEKPRSAKGATASFRPVMAGAKEIPLTYDEKSDTLRGKTDPIAQGHADALLSITPAGGSAISLRLTFHLEGHVGHEGHEAP